MSIEYRRVWPAGELVRVVLPARLDHLRKDYEAGIGNALHEAVRYCHEHALPLPDWAMEALDAEAAVALGQASAIKRKGKRASAMKAREHRQKQLIKAALQATEKAGLTGEHRLVSARDMLSELGIMVSTETLRSPKSLSEVDFSTSQYNLFRRQLNLTEEQHGYLIED